MISLLNPAILPWLLMASVPLIIHLLTRRTRRRIEIPTVIFLQRSLAQQSRVFRWRHLLLLLLRVAAVCALVFVFARPTFNSPLAGPRGANAAVVLVLDTSASMGYADSGTSTLARASSTAAGILDGLGSGARANVILCGARPHAAAAEPSADIAGLSRAVRAARPTEERADPNAALNMAVEQLGKSQARDKRIYLISDFQRSNWADVKFESVPAGVTVDFVDAAPETRSNCGLTALRLAPSTPHIGEPLTVEADVFNSSAQTRTAPVTLSTSTGIRQSQTVTIQPYSSATATFPLQFDTAQRALCTVAIPADADPLDDTRRIVVDLKRMPLVVLVTGEDSAKAGTASFFLAHALHPDPSSNAGFRVVAVAPAAATDALLHSADAVIVCDAPQMPAAQYRTLAQYATGGGSLVWVLYGDRIADQIAGLGKLLPATEPMPLQIDHVADLAGNGKGYVSLAEAHYDSPMLKAFKDPSAADLTAARFNRICVTGEVDPRAETLLKFDDGTAAAVHTVEGSGNLLLINMAPAPSWSDLARQPAFVPMMHEFLKGLLGKNASAPEFVAGGSAQASVAAASGAGAKVTCSGPDGDVPVTSDAATGSLVIDVAPKAGFYNVVRGSAPIAALAVNTDADETDLRPIDPRDLETRQKKVSTFFASVGGADDLQSLGKGRPVWPYLVALALLLLFAEQWLGRLAPKARRA